ncbi:MAG: DUF2723 domain-containing protein [Pedobacter sp.]|nr:MAG: DUF2723 domain-containing protein [Pedobacter sp.]
MNYKKVNNLMGWLCFFIATISYTLTLEPTVSFWDCGEFIASALKMQVVHQPGAPLFLMIERFFSLFAFGDNTKVAYFMNLGSAIASGATILFLFWTITALAKKLIAKTEAELNTGKLIAIMGAGAVGALAYTFSDSFWFSAVEAEVYALSSLFTAIVFWAILKWEAVADDPQSDKWLLFIAYIMGLSIGIHLLNLLTIPAIAFVYYFRKVKNPTNKGVFKTFLVGVLILAIIQYGIIQYLVSLGAHFDLFFVNTLGLGFGSGVIAFAIILIASLVFGIRYSIKKQHRVLNLALLSVVLVIFGYTSFAMIIIRAQAKPNLNNSNPDNAFSFLSYLNREQYGDRPLLFGPNYNSIPLYKEDGSRPITKEKGKVYRKGESKYEVAGLRTKDVYAQNAGFPDSLRRLQKEVLFPRMYSDDSRHVNYYQDMMNLSDTDFPSFFTNFGFFLKYQTGLMYMRYFMWNFAGRQNDLHGQGSLYEGQWLSGVKPIDALLLGDQSNLPPTIKESNAYNRYFFLPLIIGLIGAFWHFKKNQKDAGIVGLLFFFTGLAIVIYLNQKPLEPRERDYAYVGSFYAFAIWIGIGVLAITDWLSKKVQAKQAAILATAACILAAPVLMAAQGWDDHDRSEKWLARDVAINYLESCAPNAILFTYGDNDTYPLWYAQEVENIRPDVRLVNLSLFDTDWYIDNLQRKVHESEALPLSMKPAQYVSGVRDVMYFQDYKIAEPVELKQIVDLLLSDDDEDKMALSNNTKVNFTPTLNFKLSVNPSEAIKNGAVPAADSARIATEVVWKFNKNYITKGNLALLDILAHNNWKRPVYFCTTVPSDQYIGLDNYLYNEGMAYRLMPYKVSAQEDETNRLNTAPMYENVMNKFKWGNIKSAKYLDLQSQDDLSIFNNLFTDLARALILEGKTVEAKKVMERREQVIPDKLYSMRTLMSVPNIIENLYLLGETEKANAQIRKAADFVRKEVNYLADVSKSKNTLVGGQNVQIALIYGLDHMKKIAEEHKQTKIAKELDDTFGALYDRFSQYFGPRPQ